MCLPGILFKPLEYTERMAINYDTLINWTFEDVPHQYTERDTILYALGLGLGRDPLNKDELHYTYEKGLVALPTLAVTLSTLGMWVKHPDTGINVVKLVHSGQGATFHKPLPVAASVIGRARVRDVYDRGAGKGAILVLERSIYDAKSNECYCTLEQTLMLRGDGGFGGEPPPASSTLAIPDRSADLTGQWQTSPGQAILYRLSGDLNPLHIDPDVASKAGFSQPILHGFCSYGIAGWIATQVSDRPASDLLQLDCRFTAPVIPGERIDFQFWQQDSQTLLFKALVGDRIVLTNGLAKLEQSTKSQSYRTAL